MFEFSLTSTFLDHTNPDIPKDEREKLDKATKDIQHKAENLSYNEVQKWNIFLHHQIPKARNTPRFNNHERGIEPKMTSEIIVLKLNVQKATNTVIF